MKTQTLPRKTALIASLALTGLAFTAQAGKPGGGGTTNTPTHRYVSLGDGWYNTVPKISDSGLMAGSQYLPGPEPRSGDHPFVVIPADPDGNGLLDWFADANGDQWNDLAIDLGFPTGFADTIELWQYAPPVINDAAQVAGAHIIWLDDTLTTSLDALYVFTPGTLMRTANWNGLFRMKMGPTCSWQRSSSDRPEMRLRILQRSTTWARSPAIIPPAAPGGMGLS